MQIKVEKKDAKFILNLIMVALLLWSIGCVYTGYVYSQDKFVADAGAELNGLLRTNFSYVCYQGQDQFYLSNLTIKLGGADET